MPPGADRSVRVRLRAETSQFNRSVRESAREVDKLDRKLRDLRDADVNVRVRLDNNAINRDLRGLRSRLDAWESQHGRISVRATLDDDLTGELARLRSQLAAETLRIRARVSVDDGDLERDFAGIRAKLILLGAESTTVRVYLDNNTEPELSELVAKVRMLRQRVNIRVNVRDDSAADLAAISARLRLWVMRQEQLLNLRLRVNETGGGLRGAAGQVQEIGQAGKIALAILAALPALATAVAGTVTFAIGGVFTALPILAWKSSEEVKDAYSDLWSDIKDGIRDLTPAWESEIAGWTDIVREMGRDWRPTLEEAFEQARPAVTQFFSDFGEATNQLKPGFEDLIDGFTAMLGKLGQQMPGILAALGDGFGALGQAMEQHPEAFGQLLQDLAELVRLIGQVSQAAVAMYPAMSAVLSLVGDFNDLLDVSVGNGYTFLDLLSVMGSTLFMFVQGPFGLLLKGLDLVEEKMGWTGQSANELGVAAGGAATGFQTSAAGARDLVDSLDLAILSADELRAKLERLTSGALNKRESLRQYEAAVDDVTAALKRNGRTLDTDTEAGRKNEKVLDDLAKKSVKALLAMKEAHDSPETIARKAGEYRRTWIEQAQLFGMNAKKANALADDIFGLDQALEELPKQGINMAIGADTGPAMESVREAQEIIRGMIAAFAVNAAVNVRVGGASRPANPNADGAIYPSVRAFAAGSERHVAQIARPGEWRLWAEPETGGEAYIPLAASKRPRSTRILGAVAARFGLDLVQRMGPVRAFAAGGLTGTDIQLSGLLGDWRGVVNPSTAEELKDALEGRADRQEALAEAITDLAEARKARQEQIKDAAQDVRDAKRERKEAVADRKLRITEAKERLKEARISRKESLRDARQAVKDAQQDLAAARKAKDKSRIKSAERQLRDAKQRLKTEERTSANSVRNAERDLKQAQQDKGVSDADRRLTEAEERLKEARAEGGLKQIADAEKRIKDARVDLAEATERLLDVEDRRKYDLMRPSDQLSAALALGISNTGQFIANLQALADRGFGNLAQQLLNMSGAEAEKIAADAVTLSNQQLGNLQGQIETRQQQQATLALLPQMLPVRSAIRAGTNTWSGLLDATGLDPGTLAEVLKAMPELAKSSQGQSLLADMKNHGYAHGGWIGGVGGPTEDANLIWASRREFMVNARQAMRHGPLLEAINSGAYPKQYAGGGWIGTQPALTAGQGGDLVINNTINTEPMSPNQLAREIGRETAWLLR